MIFINAVFTVQSDNFVFSTVLYCYNRIYIYFFSQDGDHAAADGPHESDLEGTVEKYIVLKVKVCIFVQSHLFIFNKRRLK